jgi:hypothetical protein
MGRSQKNKKKRKGEKPRGNIKPPRHTYLDWGKTIFLFLVTMTTVVAIPTPGSYRWGGGGGRATEASAAEDPRSGHTGASGAEGQPSAAVATASFFCGGGEGTSLEGDLPAAPTTGVSADASKGAVLYAEASPPPTESVRLLSGLSSLGAVEEVPRNTSIWPGPRGQTPALSSGSVELPWGLGPPVGAPCGGTLPPRLHTSTTSSKEVSESSSSVFGSDGDSSRGSPSRACYRRRFSRASLA